MSITKDQYAIVGLGVTKQGRVPGPSATDFKTEGLKMAIEDAGLKPSQVGGYIYQPGMMDMTSFAGPGDIPRWVGIHPNFIWSIQTGGVSAITAVLAACAAIDAGIANYVGIGYGDAALSGSVLVGAAGMLGSAQRDTPGSFGMYAPGPDHALAAQRHMALYGTTKEQLGHIALTQRENAQKRPDAYMCGRPMTMDDYLNARSVSEPLGKYDYCLVADGGCGIIITSAERAKDHKNPVYISGIGQGHAITTGYDRIQYTEFSIKAAKDNAFRMAGMELKDMDVAQLYDCFTLTVLLAMEDYGFCAKGEGGPYAEAGKMKIDGGSIPINTSGNELSWSYMQGFTPLVEGIRQMRDEGGATQVKDAKACLVSGHGGTGMGSMEYAEGTLILTRR